MTLHRLLSWLPMALSVLVLAGCSCLKPQSQSQAPTRIACVGDSITFGSGVEHRETNNYPVVLGQLLGSRYETKNFGVGGATLLKKGDKPYWSQKEFTAATDYAPNIVVIKLGTNDSKPQNWRHHEEFAADLTSLIQHFRSLPSHPKIWLCLPAPVYGDRWGITQSVVDQSVIPTIRQVARQQRVSLIDLHKALDQHPEWFPDQIHPNAAGARVMAQTVAHSLRHP